MTDREDGDERALVPESADQRRLRRVSTLLLAGGGLAVLAGMFAGSVMIALLGAGWIFGGAAVASTIPQR
jgi:hypothetical protein